MPLKGVSKPLGIPFIELQTVDSTNKYAMGLIHEGMATHGITVLSHEQTKGRGQRGKGWLSEKNANLTFSIVVDPTPLKTTHLFDLLVCTSVSVREIFDLHAGGRTSIKWPNDIYWNDRKAGGILIENVISSSRWKWSVLGIGLNINQTTFPNDLPNPVSLKQITGKQHHVSELAKEICKVLSKNFNQLIVGKSQELFAEYRKYLYKKNEVVKFRKGQRMFKATLKDVTDSGKLVVFHTYEESFDFGEVEWVIGNEQ